MKREIKFRGFRTDGKGWVYGFYYLDEDYEPAILQEEREISDLDGKDDIIYVSYKVVPETIGQFIGIKGTQSAEIYEGDINKSGTVFLWNEEKSLFCLHYWSNIGMYCISSYPILDTDTFEVIGNIHENPELLK